MRAAPSAILLTCAAGLVGCSDSARTPIEPLIHSHEVLPQVMRGGVIESVMGHAAVQIDLDFPFGVLVKVSVSVAALRHSDGTVTGHYRRETESATLGTLSFEEGPVTCFTIFDENRAVIGGLIDRSNVDHESPRSITFAVADNGEGNNDSPDQFSGFAGEGPAGSEHLSCADPVTRFTSLFPSEQGNIEVRAAQ